MAAQPYWHIISFNQANRDQWVHSVANRLPAGTRILDVGAGECRYKALFSHCDYEAQDFAEYHGVSEGVLKETWQYGALDYVCDATNIPVKDASFDAVLCTEVLEHVSEPINVIREIGRIVRPGGLLFLSAPLGSGLHQQPYHFYGGYTPHFYRRFLPEAGFEITSIEPNGHFFLLLLQEIYRAFAIIRGSKLYPVWHPVRWLLRAFDNPYFVNWLAYLDGRIPVDEFTVGYHVEAVKLASNFPDKGTPSLGSSG